MKKNYSLQLIEDRGSVKVYKKIYDTENNNLEQPENTEVVVPQVNYFKAAKGYVVGTVNQILQDPEIEALAEARLTICRECPLFNAYKCDSARTTLNEKGQTVHGCTCNLKKKVRNKDEKCTPLGKW
jgi:predicted oxidoreductase